MNKIHLLSLNCLPYISSSSRGDPERQTHARHSTMFSRWRELIPNHMGKPTSAREQTTMIASTHEAVEGRVCWLARAASQLRQWRRCGMGSGGRSCCELHTSDRHSRYEGGGRVGHRRSQSDFFLFFQSALTAFFLRIWSHKHKGGSPQMRFRGGSEKG